MTATRVLAEPAGSALRLVWRSCGTCLQSDGRRMPAPTHKFSVPWRTSFVEQLSLLCRTVAVVPRVQTSRVNRMWAMRKNDRVVGFSNQSARFVGVLHCETTPSARRRAHHAGRGASTALPRGVLRSRCHHCKQHLFLQARLRCHLFCRILAHGRKSLRQLCSFLLSEIQPRLRGKEHLLLRDGEQPHSAPAALVMSLWAWKVRDDRGRSALASDGRCVRGEGVMHEPYHDAVWTQQRLPAKGTSSPQSVVKSCTQRMRQAASAERSVAAFLFDAVVWTTWDGATGAALASELLGNS